MCGDVGMEVAVLAEEEEVKKVVEEEKKVKRWRRWRWRWRRSGKSIFRISPLSIFTGRAYEHEG
jgi:hypothetical protein